MEHTTPSDTAPAKALTGRAVLLVLLKDGLRGIWRACLLTTKTLLHLAWSLRHPLLRLPSALAAAVRFVLSSKLGRAIVAVAASLVCVSLHFNRNGGAHVHVSSSLSLLFGLIRLEGSAVVELGRPNPGDEAANVERQGDEFRINCPQGLKEHIVRFLETQAARDPAAMPPWQLSPQKNHTPGPQAHTRLRASATPPPLPSPPPPFALASAAIPPPATVGLHAAAPKPANGAGAVAAPANAPYGFNSPPYTTIGTDADVGAAAGTSALQSDGHVASGGDVLRLVESLLPPLPLTQVPPGAAEGASSAAAACGSPTDKTPRRAGVSALGSQLASPDATPDYGRSTGSAHSTLSRTSVASNGTAPEPSSRTTHIASGPAASPGRQPGGPDGLSHASPSPPHRPRAPEAWHGPPNVPSSLAPSAAGDPRVGSLAYASLMAVAGSYKPSRAPFHTATALAPPPPGAASATASSGTEVDSVRGSFRDDNGGDNNGDDEPAYSPAVSRYGSAGSSCYGSATSAASTASAGAGGGAAAAVAAPGQRAPTGLRKNPDSILGLRGIGLEGWHQNVRAWEELHMED